MTFERGEQRRRDLCHLDRVLVVDCFKKLSYHFGSLQFVLLEITSECSVARSEADQDAVLIQEESLTQKSAVPVQCYFALVFSNSEPKMTKGNWKLTFPCNLLQDLHHLLKTHSDLVETAMVYC